jgi:hypothetical protein
VFVGSDLLNFKVANSHEFLYNIFLFDHVWLISQCFVNISIDCQPKARPLF